jgi:hypothetical protein
VQEGGAGGGGRFGAADFTLPVFIRRGRFFNYYCAVVGLLPSISVDGDALIRSGADVGGRLL